MKNQSDWLNRADYTAEERRNICAQIMTEAQYWDVHQYLKMMSDSTKRPWVGLTDKAITQVIDSMPRGIRGWMSDWDLYEFARAIEAKLKENT